MPTDRELIAELRERVEEIAVANELQTRPLAPVMEHVETGVLNVAPARAERTVAVQPFSTPDVTTTQIATAVAGLSAVLGVITAAPERLQVPLLIAIAIVGAAYLVSDAIIRFGRARGNADRLG